MGLIESIQVTAWLTFIVVYWWMLLIVEVVLITTYIGEKMLNKYDRKFTKLKVQEVYR